MLSISSFIFFLIIIDSIFNIENTIKLKIRLILIAKFGFDFIFLNFCVENYCFI